MSNTLNDHSTIIQHSAVKCRVIYYFFICGSLKNNFGHIKAGGLFLKSIRLEYVARNLYGSLLFIVYIRVAIKIGAKDYIPCPNAYALPPRKSGCVIILYFARLKTGRGVLSLN
jgi:hypothetical protein